MAVNKQDCHFGQNVEGDQARLLNIEVLVAYSRAFLGSNMTLAIDCTATHSSNQNKQVQHRSLNISTTDNAGKISIPYAFLNKFATKNSLIALVTKELCV